jgi:hypothetical protein
LRRNGAQNRRFTRYFVPKSTCFSPGSDRPCSWLEQNHCSVVPDRSMSSPPGTPRPSSLRSTVAPRAPTADHVPNLYRVFPYLPIPFRTSAAVRSISRHRVVAAWISRISTPSFTRAARKVPQSPRHLADFRNGRRLSWRELRRWLAAPEPSRPIAWTGTPRLRSRRSRPVGCARRPAVLRRQPRLRRRREWARRIYRNGCWSGVQWWFYCDPRWASFGIWILDAISIVAVRAVTLEALLPPDSRPLVTLLLKR